MTFKSLSQFYTSSEWRKFRQIVISDRINKADGILYDEFNGKPILQSHDIILHHVIELTMQNVNDYSVSLNPENIMIVSIKSHNEIHNRFGGRVQSWQRKVYYVYGAPCSGKSTFVRENMQRGDLVCDIDRIWQAVSGQPAYIKPKELKPIVFKIHNALLDSILIREGNWQTAWVIEGGALIGDRKRRLEALGAEDIFIDATKEVCLARLANDEDRRFVQEQWVEYIERWFEEYQPDTIIA